MYIKNRLAAVFLEGLRAGLLRRLGPLFSYKSFYHRSGTLRVADKWRVLEPFYKVVRLAWTRALVADRIKHSAFVAADFKVASFRILDHV